MENTNNNHAPENKSPGNTNPLPGSAAGNTHPSSAYAVTGNANPMPGNVSADNTHPSPAYAATDSTTPLSDIAVAGNTPSPAYTATDSTNPLSGNAVADNTHPSPAYAATGNTNPMPGNVSAAYAATGNTNPAPDYPRTQAVAHAYNQPAYTLNGYQNSPRNKAPLTFTVADKLLVPAMCLCGFFFWEWIMQYQPAAGIFAFTVIIVGSTLLYFRSTNTKQNKKSLPVLGLLLLTSTYFLIFDSSYIQIFIFLFLSSLYLYWIAISTGTRLVPRLSGLTLFDLLNQWLVAPFANITAIFKAFHSSLSNKRSGKNILLALLGIVIFLPVLGYVITLLTNADDAFQDLWNNLTETLDISVYFSHILSFVLGIPVAAYLYGSLFGNVRKHNSDLLKEKDVISGLSAMKRIPGALIYAPVALFNCIYLLFFIALGGYFFSALSGVLPDTLTYAEYARKGFFELCGVAAINLCILIAVYALLKRDGKKVPLTLRLFMGLMSLQTILLIITAMSKMFLYISSYGLTRLRIHTTWFMAMLLVVFLLILVWHIKKFNLAKPLILTCTFFVLLLTFGNGDGIIAKYNIQQYENGNVETLDYVTLAQLSDAAMPYIYERYRRSPDHSERNHLYRVMQIVGQEYYLGYDYYIDSGESSENIYQELRNNLQSEEGFPSWNIQSYKANQIRASLFQ